MHPFAEAATLGTPVRLQGGDCAEAFSQFSANRIRDLFRLILQVRPPACQHSAAAACACICLQRCGAPAAALAAAVAAPH